jgi:hypothetical protein
VQVAHDSTEIDANLEDFPNRETLSLGIVEVLF